MIERVRVGARTTTDGALVMSASSVRDLHALQVEAKRNKDYPTADRIRADLRNLGIQAEEFRPPPVGRR